MSSESGTYETVKARYGLGVQVKVLEPGKVFPLGPAAVQGYLARKKQTPPLGPP